jgi:hypothetical protein
MGRHPWRVCHVRVTVLVCKYVYLFGGSFLLLNLYTRLAQGPPRPRSRTPPPPGRAPLPHNTAASCRPGALRLSVNIAETSPSQSYFATVSQTFSQSVLALRPSATHDQILAVVRQLREDVMGRRPWRVDGPVTTADKNVVTKGEKNSLYRESDPGGSNRSKP